MRQTNGLIFFKLHLLVKLRRPKKYKVPRGKAEKLGKNDYKRRLTEEMPQRLKKGHIYGKINCNQQIISYFLL